MPKVNKVRRGKVQLCKPSNLFDIITPRIGTAEEETFAEKQRIWLKKTDNREVRDTHIPHMSTCVTEFVLLFYKEDCQKSKIVVAPFTIPTKASARELHPLIRLQTLTRGPISFKKYFCPPPTGPTTLKHLCAAALPRPYLA